MKKGYSSQLIHCVCKTTAKDKEEEVAVAIGLMEFNEKESKLKPVREKRVML